ncbi:MAG: ABC transporter substrate-binding protein [Clostridiaceae bacterium]|jgi:branched-chain amino acid transport system substrate-binding protein|nr:ABC transporter substrate-binding protein [Clostridia bacterium]NMA35754.1 ABC transporter substrate-binding protein [Clostridiaceae bacterium]
MKKYLAILLSLIVLLGIVACGPSTPETPDGSKTEAPDTSDSVPDEPVNKDPIIIGCIQDTSGGASSAGQPNEWGVKYAVQWINDNGGVNGRPIVLHTRDCQNDTEIAVTNYRELVDEVGVCAIIGPPLSNPASAWVDLATEDKIPIVGHFMDELCTTDPDTGEVYPYMFLAEPSCAAQSYILADYAMSELNVKKVASLFNISNAFAVAHEKPFMEFVKAHGGEVLAQENFTWTDTDYSAQAQKIAALNPDAVFLCDYRNQVVTAYDNLRDAGYTGLILGANTLYTPFNTVIKNSPPYGCYFLQNYNMNDKETGIIGELVAKQMAETGTEYQSANVGFGWDATMVLYEAMKKAKDPTNGEEVRDLLENDTKDVLLSGGKTITIDPATHRPTNALGMYIATYSAENEVEYLVYKTTDYTGK